MGANEQPRADLLRRVAETGLSDREVEKQVPLAQAWLSKARKGGNDGGRAEVAWERLRTWLDTRSAPPPPSPRPEAHEAPPPAPRSSASAANDKARAELVKAMRAAKTLEELDLVTALVFQGIAEGWILGSESNRFVQVIESRRKTIEQINEQNARKAETGPRRIEVVYVQDWRAPAPEPLTVSGTSSATPPTGT